MFRIIHVITTINRGGAENHLFDLVKLQKNQDYEILILYLKGNGYWTESYRAMGIKVYPLNFSAYQSIIFDRRLKKLIRDWKPDLVHAHMPPAELYCRINLLGDQKTPFVISKHNDKKFAPLVMENALMKWVAKRAAKLIAISGAVQSYFVNKGIHEDSISVIHYGFDPTSIEILTNENRNKLKKELDLSNTALIIGTVARLVPQKSIDTLLKAYDMFLQKNKVESQLLIVGEGPLLNDLKNLAAPFQRSTNIKFLGFREDVYSVMQLMDVFVLPSIHEGFGLVLLEAMAVKRSIIASTVSAIPEVLGDSGILVPPKDVNTLAEKMSLLQDEEARKKLGQKAFQRLNTNFKLEQMMTKTQELYKALVEKKIL